MLILGFESSCDETGVALYDTETGTIKGESLFSQIDMHALYGGVVPELASRDHVKRIAALTRECLKEAGASFEDVDYVACTEGPGLAGALLAGMSFANSLAFSLGVPFIGVHHLEGHLLSPLMGNSSLKFPFLALLVSGGHTQILAVRRVADYELLGESVDDAAGEAFDKTAKILGLPYPGGKYLAQKAQKGRERHMAMLAKDPKAEPRFVFPRPMLGSGDLNMSFSGLKTAALTEVARHKEEMGGNLDDEFVEDVSYAFEEAVTDVLARKVAKALKKTGMRDVVVAGGVSANLRLREKFAKLRGRSHFPALGLCTDNGAMIAHAASYHLDRAREPLAFGVRPRWSFEDCFKKK